VIEDASLYVKQSAWLQTAPKPPETKSKTSTPKPDKQMTRLERMEAQGQQPPLPPMGAAGHLVGYLFEVGPVGYGAMGPVPLSHTELAAWQANTGIALEAWEAKALRRLSMDYLAASNAAHEADCPPFYLEQPVQENRHAVSNAVRNILGGRAQQPAPKGH
jgi:hypothetical protein